MTKAQRMEIERLAKREINTLKIGKVELQNNHGHLLCFCKGYLIFSYWINNAGDHSWMKSEYESSKYYEIFGNRKEQTRIENIFLALIREYNK